MNPDVAGNAESSGEEDSIVCIIVDRAQLKSMGEALVKDKLQHPTFKTKPLPNEPGLFALPVVVAAEDSCSRPSMKDHAYTLRHLPVSTFSKSRIQSTARQLLSSLFTTFIGSHPEYANLAPPTSYTIYSQLLLLPPSPLSTWPTPARERFIPLLLTATKTTHVALNAPIPPSSSAGENVLRSPCHLVPLAGNFGPLHPSDPPSTTDFAQAFWTSTRQNGLTQIWAPRWTMFSARNHREKTRILRLPCVQTTQPATAVDLYVGIGYFALSYLSAGVETVLGWDLNPWSIEGARRGARENRFAVSVGEEKGATGLRLFCEDNDLARKKVERLRKDVAPVRHVNCGLLPTSERSWESAVGCLDKRLGGWVRVHENFRVDEVPERSEWVRRTMQGIVDAEADWMEGTTVVLEQVFKVKSYAPGVLHVVVDIRIDPKRKAES